MPTEDDREKAREILTRERLSIAHNEAWLAEALASERAAAVAEIAALCDMNAADWLSAEESAKKAGVAAASWTYGTKADAAKKIAAAIRALGGTDAR